MIRSREIQPSGSAAPMAGTICADLPRLVRRVDLNNAAFSRVATRPGAVRIDDFQGARVWGRRRVARNGVSTRVETEGRCQEDVKKTSGKGL